ncbi:MAG: hypothetical protein KBT02_05205 [Treponema sp.]|nr:hypothetical protein [Candidatus Treponema caballi]
MSSIVTLCLSAGIQKTITFDSLKPGEVNRSRSYIYDASGKAVNSARVLVQLMEADDADRGLEDSLAFECAPDNKASDAFKACPPESACQTSSDNKASGAYKAPAAPDDITLICPLGKKNADFFLQLAARDGLNPEAVLIPGYTRECCTLLDEAAGEVTELVVEEPTPEDEAPVSDLLFTLRTALARASAFNRLEDSAPACQASSDNKASGTYRELEDSAASQNAAADRASGAFKAAGALPRTALLFAGSRPAFWPQDAIQQIALAAKKAGALFMADFRGNDLLSLLPASVRGECSLADKATSANKAASAFKACPPALTPDIIKINEAEFRETFMRGADELAAAICEKSRELGNIIVVTRGADSTLAADRGTLYECASEKVRAVNTIGCGDSFNAGFLYEYMTSCNVEMALKKGTWCAARNAERLSPGTIR